MAVIALTADATRVVMVAPDSAGHFRAPTSFDVLTVETTGHLTKFTPETSRAPLATGDVVIDSVL